jgi:general secretion pathway protein M
MTGTFKTWWRARTGREQAMLLAMIALAAIVFAWLLIIRPLDVALEAARTRHAAAAAALAEARAEAEAIGGAEAATPTRAPLPVDGFISRGATEAGFADARITSQGPTRAATAIPAARPQAFFGWIARMEASGLVVERLSARANSDRTISVEADLRAREP